MNDSRVERTGDDAKIWLVLLGIIVLFTVVILYARHINIGRLENSDSTPLIASYTNYAYGVNLRFPPEWHVAGGYGYDRYEGEDGFFGVSAGGAGRITIDEMARNEASHDQKPYGSTPEIKNLVIDGQEARLIIPSEDQDPAMDNQAALIIEYPVPRTVSGEEHKFFIFWADKDHIEKISESITFIRPNQ